MISCFRNKKGKEETGWAMKNGRMLLEESVTLFDGKVNPIRHFSARELEIATNNFDEKQLLFDSLYRGFIQGRVVFVKRCNGRFWENWVRGIVVASRLSAHKNVLKPIGCCLETQVPRVIYESFDSAELLHDCLGLSSYSNRHDLQPSLPWKHRLKAAVDLSNIVAYLHTALRRPLVYRDINPSNVILDKENGVIKLCNFELCMFLSEEEPFIVDQPIVGTIGYLDPEYYRTARFNELPWKLRLKIAVDLSNIVAYLHTAFPRPLIILDKENGVIKLLNFELCMFMPEAEPFIENQPVVGSGGDVAPEYLTKGQLSVKVDVYAFGVTLLNLLSGPKANAWYNYGKRRCLKLDARDCMENQRFDEILDPRLSADGPWPGKDGQFEEVLMLALQCTRDNFFDRPDMTHIGMRLAGMYRSAYSDS